jgi:hypothetical protein
MWLERMVVGMAAALWAAFVPGAATSCLDHRWELPSERARLALRTASERAVQGRVPS